MLVRNVGPQDMGPLAGPMLTPNKSWFEFEGIGPIEKPRSNLLMQKY